MDKHISSEFNLRNDIIHLNHAGVSPWPLRTVKAVRKFADENMVQGSLQYLEWLEVETGLRKQAQKLINAPSPLDIALLKNTSEALSVVAYGLEWKKGDNIVSCSQEFPSNRIVWESLVQKGVGFREADFNISGNPEDALFSLVDNNTRLITISSVQFSTGLSVDLKRIGEFCKKRGILFCVDAIQSLGAMQFDVQQIQADFVMADGHKWMLGPEGLAIFYSNPDARDRLHLNQYGWHMVEDAGNFDRRDWSVAKSARRFECGSPNMLGIYALNASLSLILETGMDYIEREILKRSEYLFDKIKAISELELITSTRQGRYAGIVTFRRRGVDSALLYQNLMQQKILCAHRSGGIRLSPHFYTPYEQLDHVIELVIKYTA
jgi:selenocysteine lyase/cysteine desulfurase